MAPFNKTKRPLKAPSPLYYAMIFDIIGAPYEFKRNNTWDYNFNLFPKPERFKRFPVEFTDDSLLSAAIARIIRTSDIKNEKEFIANGVKIIKEFVRKYPDGTFPGFYGGAFANWATMEGTETAEEAINFKSFGDGSAMRVSAVGWAYNNLKDTLTAAKLTALPSHSDPEGIKGAQAIAAAIYLARSGASKDDIKAYIETEFGYDLDRTLKEHKHYHQVELREQTEVCQTTVPMALRAFLEGDGFEDCGRKGISIGGDSDTIGAMVGSVAGAFYGMPRWLEEECEKRLDSTLLNEAKDFKRYIDAKDTEPDREELDNVLAKARLESYVLQQYKKNKKFVPKDDEKFRDLLAKKEAVRLFYDEVNKAVEKKDETTVRLLTENKDKFVEKLASGVKTAPEFVNACNKFKKCPVKMEDRVETDDSPIPKYNKRIEGVPSTFRKKVEVVEHGKFPEKIAMPGIKADELLSQGLADARAELEHKNRVLILVEAAEKAQNGPASDKPDLVVATESHYLDAINKMISKDGDVAKYFPNRKMPEKLKSALIDLMNINVDTVKSDPVKLSDNALTKLGDVYEELIRSENPENSETVVNQIAFINRLANAVNEWRDAPRDTLRIVSTLDAENKKLDDAVAALEKQNEGLIIVGNKTASYYNAIVNELSNAENVNARFDAGNLPAELSNALTSLKNGDAKAALPELVKLSEQLKKDTADNKEYKLVAQSAYVNHLLNVVNDAANAPADPTFDANDPDHKTYDELCKSLTERAKAIGDVIEKSENKKGNIFELAERAQRACVRIQECVSDGFINKNDTELQHLKNGNCYATLSLHQHIQKFVAVSKLDPETAADPKRKEEIAKQVNDAKKVLADFETKNLDEAIYDLKYVDTFRYFENNLTVSDLAQVMKTSDGLMKAYDDTMPMLKAGIKAEAEAKAKADAEKAEKERLEEEKRKAEEEKRIAHENKIKKDQMLDALHAADEIIQDCIPGEQIDLESYKAGIDTLVQYAEQFPDNPRVQKQCGKALLATITHAAESDKEIKNNSRTKALNNYIKKEAPTALRLIKETQAEEKREAAIKAMAKELENDRRQVKEMKDTFTFKKGESEQYTFNDYKKAVMDIDRITQKFANDPILLKLCGDTVNNMLNYIANTDDPGKGYPTSNAIANDKEMSRSIQNIIKKGSVAERQLKEAEKALEEEPEKQNESNLLGK